MKTLWSELILAEQGENGMVKLIYNPKRDAHYDPVRYCTPTSRYVCGLRNFRAYNSMSQVFFWPDAERGESEDSDDWSGFGPTVDEIDWTGFPAE